MGISIDSVDGHIAFQKEETGELHFPLCSDFFPHGDVAERYGVLRTGNPLPGISERAIFVIDKQGRIAFRKIYHLGEQPDFDEALAAVRKLSLAEQPQKQ